MFIPENTVEIIADASDEIIELDQDSNREPAKSLEQGSTQQETLTTVVTNVEDVVINGKRKNSSIVYEKFELSCEGSYLEMS